MVRGVPLTRRRRFANHSAQWLRAHFGFMAVPIALGMLADIAAVLLAAVEQARRVTALSLAHIAVPLRASTFRAGHNALRLVAVDFATGSVWSLAASLATRSLTPRFADLLTFGALTLPSASRYTTARASR